MDYSKNFRNRRFTPEILPARQRRQKFQKVIFRLVILAMVSLLLFFSARYWWREMRWRFIVIHHSAGARGNLAYIRRIHMRERAWPDIAYHFVINNGSFNTTMGQVEKSNLWLSRSPNLSTRDSYINSISIAVVLIGNFNRRQVPPRQREAMIRLLVHLARKYRIPPERIIRHRDVNETECPGRKLNILSVRRDVEKELNN